MAVLNIIIGDQEKTLLKKDAHAHEMNVSEYVRWLIEKERGNQPQTKNDTRHLAN